MDHRGFVDRIINYPIVIITSFRWLSDREWKNRLPAPPLPISRNEVYNRVTARPGVTHESRGDRLSPRGRVRRLSDAVAKLVIAHRRVVRDGRQ